MRDHRRQQMASESWSRSSRARPVAGEQARGPQQRRRPRGHEVRELRALGHRRSPRSSAVSRPLTVIGPGPRERLPRPDWPVAAHRMVASPAVRPSDDHLVGRKGQVRRRRAAVMPAAAAARSPGRRGPASTGPCRSNRPPPRRRATRTAAGSPSRSPRPVSRWPSGTPTARRSRGERPPATAPRSPSLATSSAVAVAGERHGLAELLEGQRHGRRPLEVRGAHGCVVEPRAQVVADDEAACRRGDIAASVVEARRPRRPRAPRS